MKFAEFTRNTLGPEELRLASEAFQAALAEVGETELHPFVIRRSLSQHVMHSIFAGARDAVMLREGALASLRSLEAGNLAKKQHAPPTSSNENNCPLSFAKA